MNNTRLSVFKDVVLFIKFILIVVVAVVVVAVVVVVVVVVGISTGRTVRISPISS
jgi:hypothetical protein